MKIVAIGGGNIGNHDDRPYDMLEIDEEIVRLTQKPHPRLLNICFNIKSNYHYGYLKKNYTKLGVQCERLGYEEFTNAKTIENKFKRADILYLSGGNTVEYMNKINKFGLANYILEFVKSNRVIAGTSAGAIICHKYGSSDARKYKNGMLYTRVNGLNLINALYSPHYTNSNRQLDMPRILLKNKKLVGLGVDECAAIVYEGDEYRILKSKKEARVFKCYYDHKNYFESEVFKSGKIKDLISK